MEIGKGGGEFSVFSYQRFSIFKFIHIHLYLQKITATYPKNFILNSNFQLHITIWEIAICISKYNIIIFIDYLAQENIKTSKGFEQ